MFKPLHKDTQPGCAHAICLVEFAHGKQHVAQNAVAIGTLELRSDQRPEAAFAAMRAWHHGRNFSIRIHSSPRSIWRFGWGVVDYSAASAQLGYTSDSSDHGQTLLSMRMRLKRSLAINMQERLSGPFFCQASILVAVEGMQAWKSLSY